MSSLSESKNEWCARLVDTLTPAIIEGLKSIFKEALELCEENGENDKYLMTFQTFLSRIPKWNDTIISEERARIERITQCGYLEDLITCVHVIQLKALTCVRVGQKQKKIDIDIPSVNAFIHKVYINVARKLYTNVYLFEADMPPLQLQKNNRALEVFTQESILNTIRDTMPVETILRAYMDETEEEEVNIKEEIIEEPVEETPDPQEVTQEATQEATQKATQEATQEEKEKATQEEKEKATQEAPVINTPISDASVASAAAPTSVIAPENISFSNTDQTQDALGNETLVSAPKTIERLEQIAMEAAQKRRDEEDEEDDEDDRLIIGDNVRLDIADINDLNKPPPLPPPVLDDIEILS